MKVKINETYVACDICKKKISKRRYYLPGLLYQMKLKTVDEDGIKLRRKIDMCENCYDKFVMQVRKELKEAKEKENGNS